MFSFTPDVFMQTLPMLFKGMAGIFIVTGVLVLTIAALNRTDSGKGEE